MNRIKTSEANKKVVYSLTNNKYGFRDDRTIAQIAIAYSIQSNDYFGVEHYGTKDNKGKEYPDSLLGEINRQSNDVIYRAVLNQHYGRKLMDEEIPKLLKLHLDAGLEVLDREIIQNPKGKNAHIDYLLSIINNGLSLITSDASYIPTTSSDKTNIAAYDGALEIELGKDSETLEPITLRINDENYFDSQHFAVAGMNGSGKTELVKDILYQITQQTNNELKFIFFDYKGEGKSEKLQSFLKATSCEFVNIQEKPFAFNPLMYVNMVNDRERSYHIKSFKETVASIDKRIGVKQKNSLEITLKNCFRTAFKEGKPPSIIEVYEALLSYYEESNNKPDTLTGIMKDLADGVFAQDYDDKFLLYDRNLYINLPPTLPDSARQASVFLTLNYLLTKFMSCNDVKSSEDRIKPIRYIIVIDEAHAYLKHKNMASVLENLLRMVRSKGVIVMMISQGIAEYKQKEFDFSSQVKIPILLNIQNKDLKQAKSFVGTPKSDSRLRTVLHQLEGGKGVINFEESKLMDINMFWQRKL
jgi:DNA sulfur modification protein DndE